MEVMKMYVAVHCRPNYILHLLPPRFPPSHFLVACLPCYAYMANRYMTLNVPEAGVISLTKLEGSVLEPGELLATVKLEDPTKIHKV